MKFDTKTNKKMLSLKFTIPEMIDRFQDGRRRHVGNSSACYKMGNYIAGFDENWYTDSAKHADCKSHKSGSLRQKKAKIKCKKRYRFKMATLYEREVIKKQKFFIRRQKLPYSYNMWLGNRSLNFLIKLKLWCMRVFQASSVIEILIHVWEDEISLLA
jgi:hypothetical protein